MAHTEPTPDAGIDPAELSDDDLIRELRSLHRTRLDTLRHAADSALDNHLRRTAELETEYRARHPGREIDPRRLRDGAEDEDDQEPLAAPDLASRSAGGGPWS